MKSTKRTKIPVVLGVLVALHAIADARSSQLRVVDAASPRFDVASVKENKSSTFGGPIFFAPGGLFSATNATLRGLILAAYPLTVPQAQLVGGPAWLNADRFDIQARGDANASTDDRRRMLGSLLADRFHLVLHAETRELATYTLTLARSDGRLGDDLHRTGETCAPLRLPAGVPPPPPPPPPPGITPPRPDQVCMTVPGPGFLSARGITMPVLARVLATQVGSLVVDQTGLAGQFDADLLYTPSQGTAGPLGPVPPPPAAVVASDAPSIFTALQEQLGLKLQPTRGPVDVLVIDGAERPAVD